MTRTALITGAARGIGLATARLFLREGWQVAVLDIDAERQLEAASELGADALPIVADVAVEADVTRALDEVSDRFGRLDALVNNAGTAVFKGILDHTVSEWQRVIDVNLTGPFLMAQAAVPLMVRGGGGAIVNVGSISGQRGSTLRAAYGTSKAALMHLTRQMAVEFADLSIRANCVAPGPVDTAMAKKVHSPEIRRDYHDHIPLARYGLEEEIGEAIVFLCSGKASYITGETLAVDGGFAAAGIGLPTLRASQPG